MEKSEIKEKEIIDLVTDIKNLFDQNLAGEAIDIPLETLSALGQSIAMKIHRSLQPRSKERPPKTLYASEIGRPCLRSLWYSINQPHEAEPLTPSTLVKFLYGDILEELLLFLAALSGHRVEHTQKIVELPLPRGWKIRGRLDAVIDGEVVDVKTASAMGYKKFTNGDLGKEDPFGYLPQLFAYHYALIKDLHDGTETVEIIPDRAHFLVMNKQTGGIVLSSWGVSHEEKDEYFISKAESLIDELEAPTPPSRAFKDKEFGKSGNKCLVTNCSYCAYKKVCWSDANGGEGLKAFNYSGRPVFFTEIKRQPKVNEIPLD